MSRAGVGKKGSAIVLPDVGHLGTSKRHAAKFGPEYVAAQTAERRHELKPVGKFGRRVVKRQVTDARIAAGDPKTLGKAIKKTTAKIRKSLAFSRWLSSMLIRATGAAAPSTTLEARGGLDRYHQRIAERGTSIYTPQHPRKVAALQEDSNVSA